MDFSGQTINNYLARDSLFKDCNFTRCVWQGGVLGDAPPVVYRDCDFGGADLRYVGPRFARFERCHFAHARIDDWNALCAEFIECSFEGPILGAKFSATPWGFAKTSAERIRKKNDFRGNDFSRAELVDCTVAGGIDLAANRWPSGDEYVVIPDAQPRIRQAQSRLDELPKDEAKSAEAILTVLSMGPFRLQRDILVRRTELGPATCLLVEPNY